MCTSCGKWKLANSLHVTNTYTNWKVIVSYPNPNPNRSSQPVSIPFTIVENVATVFVACGLTDYLNTAKRMLVDG